MRSSATGSVTMQTQQSYTRDDSVERTGTLVMATNAEFPPYESVDGDTIVGVDVDMMQAVCDEIGMELKVENMEFDSTSLPYSPARQMLA